MQESISWWKYSRISEMYSKYMEFVRIFVYVHIFYLMECWQFHSFDFIQSGVVFNWKAAQLAEEVWASYRWMFDVHILTNMYPFGLFTRAKAVFLQTNEMNIQRFILYSIVRSEFTFQTFKLLYAKLNDTVTVKYNIKGTFFSTTERFVV